MLRFALVAVFIAFPVSVASANDDPPKSTTEQAPSAKTQIVRKKTALRSANQISIPRRPAPVRGADPGPSAIAPGCRTVNFLLRADFSNLGLLTCNPKFAQGGFLSDKYDAIKADNSVAFDGVAAVMLDFYRPVSGVNDFQIGLFAQGDYTNQFQSASVPAQTSDTLTVGAVTQAMFTANEDFSYLFRLRGGNTTGSAGVTSNTFVAEWFPIFSTDAFNVGSPGAPPSGYFVYVFLPELEVQYDRLVGGPHSYTLFATNSSAWRIGPQITLKYSLGNSTLELIENPRLHELAEKLVLSLSYHNDVDAVSGRDYSYASVSLTENITPNIGASLSYSYGNSETTANMTNQYKAGLTAKF